MVDSLKIVIDDTFSDNTKKHKTDLQTKVIEDGSWFESFWSVMYTPKSSNKHNVRFLTQTDFNENNYFKEALIDYIKSRKRIDDNDMYFSANHLIAAVGSKICFIITVFDHDLNVVLFSSEKIFPFDKDQYVEHEMLKHRIDNAIRDESLSDYYITFK